MEEANRTDEKQSATLNRPDSGPGPDNAKESEGGQVPRPSGASPSDEGGDSGPGPSNAKEEEAGQVPRPSGG